MKSHFALLSAVAIVLSVNTGQVWGKSGGGVGHASTPLDWQRGDIAARIRQAVQPKWKHRGLAWDYEELARRFDNRKFSYALSVKPDGSIAELKVRRTSGSDEIDKKGLDLITAAAPFHRARGSILTDQTYFVAFPRLTVTKESDTQQE